MFSKKKMKNINKTSRPENKQRSAIFDVGVYDPKKVEDKIYKEWKDSGYFSPEKCIEDKIVTSKDYFSIILPPPNVTGYLHIGHAVMLAIEDTMVRYRRMKGDKTLWIPGTDHAAIATQEKVERLLYEKEKKTRHDLGREKFLKKVDEFVEDTSSRIKTQIRKMGASVDWSREAFTLDKKRNLAVRTAFKKMYDDGIIYRGHRIVNWDPELKTTVSDDEVERKTEKTTFYYFKYGPFEIGTARPETKFGDKYVVMHPKDKRYEKYKHGQKIDLEWINGPITATIIKDDVIDMDFGTGVMTITPWHDVTDFDIAERHNLDKERIIDYDGKLLSIAGEFAGTKIGEAREKIVKKLESKGLLIKKDENYEHNIATNSRGGGIIEPQIKLQWFIAVNKEFKQKGKNTTLKKLMQDAVRSKKIEIIPKRFEKIYFHWIDNLRDWCISRQIWYGHQIPVWYRLKHAKIKIHKHKGALEFLRTEGKLIETYCGTENPDKAGKGPLQKDPDTIDSKSWTQDPDTLDTWFSSGLWTFSTLGWPEKTDDLKNYHPTSVLETGTDILFFWVARMILMSTYLLDGEIPFEKVYLHGLVRDEKGRKMSKSLGNIIDPLDVAEKYGTDAVRLSLMIGSTPGNDVRLNEEKIAKFRNFTNKIWNISRYIITSYKKPTNTKLKELDKHLEKNTEDLWILNKIKLLISSVSDDIENFNFSQAGEKLHDFTWNDFADWYLETSKFKKGECKNHVLYEVLMDLLKLWHPFMPFVTEAIWKELDENNLIMVEKWPDVGKYNFLTSLGKDGNNFNIIKEIIISIRNARIENKIEPKKKIKVIIDTKNTASSVTELVTEQKKLIESLRTKCELEIKEDGKKVKNSIHRTVSGINIYIPTEELIDIEKERERSEKEMKNQEKYISGIESKLKNKGFLGKAPENIINQQKESLKKAESKLKEIKKHRDSIS